jgi:hypothetical protein
MGEGGGRPGRTRSLAELLIGSIVVLLARGRRVPSARGWRPGAVEIQLPFATGRYRLRHVDGTLRHSRTSASGLMRPLLVAGFLFAFAGIGVGFGGLDVDPSTAFAPGTPGPQQVNIVQLEAEPTEPAEVASAEAPHVARALTTPTASPTATASAAFEPTTTPTEPPPAPTATPEPATPEPTATSVPITQEPEPEPAYAYYPVSQLTEAEFRATAGQAGWPEALHDQLVVVAWCESSFRPNVQTLWAYGIMQLVPSWFEYAGQDFAAWPDPVVNLGVAYAVYLYDIERGNAAWSQWVCKPPTATPAPEAPATTVTPTASSTVLAAATNESTEQ